MTSVANPNPIPPGPPGVTTPEPIEGHDLHEIQFTGMWIAEVNDTTSSDPIVSMIIPRRTHAPPSLGMWIATVDKAVDADATVVQIPAPVGLISAIERENIPVFFAETVGEEDNDSSFDDDHGLDDETTIDDSSFDGDDGLDDETAIDDSSFDDDYGLDDETTITHPNDGAATIEMFLSVEDSIASAIDYPTTDEDETTDEAGASADYSIDTYASLTQEIRDDLDNYVEPEYFDTIEVEPMVTVYRGVEFFDAVSTLSTDVPRSWSTLSTDVPRSWYHPIKPNWAAHLCTMWSNWAAHLCTMWSFWFTTVLWDTVLYILEEPRPLPRRVRRQKKRHVTIPAFPSTWMVLTGCLMLFMGVFGGHAPSFPIPTVTVMANHIHKCCQLSYEFIKDIDDMVLLNFETFTQYQVLKFRSVCELIETKTSIASVKNQISGIDDSKVKFEVGHLNDDWLNESERELKYRDLQRQERVRKIIHPTGPVILSTDSEGVLTTNDDIVVPPLPPELAAIITDPAPSVRFAPQQPTSVETPMSPAPSSAPLRRSARPHRGEFKTTRYHHEIYLTSIDHTLDHYSSHLAYLAAVSTCCDSGIENVVDPRVYAAKSHMADPNSPTFHQAMHGEFTEEYIKAMQREIATLVQQNTWTAVERTPAMNVLKGNWVFKLKRLPDGTPLRFKARFCARGDLQQEGVDFFDTYAPVVQWSTIRLLLSTVLTQGWATRQVDYKTPSPKPI